ncbi:MAG TPA: GAF domain-containing protein [Vicinamibacteria bacterium]|nr:GAF domain-containing protein [Vicinamibacteria bacterium]
MTPTAPPPPPRILVVDDDPNIARTLVDLLALHSYQADKAESGEKALDELRRERFDLVILDLRLPGISGFETCVQIREEFGPSLPVIMLTALGDTRSLRQGYESGADDFLQKPVDTPALILKVRAFLRLKALHDETVRHREEAQGRVRDLALLHEIGRDWSLIAEPEEFNRMVTQRLAGLIGASICFLALYDAPSRTMAAALPVFGIADEVARRMRYVVKPEYAGLWNFRSGRPYVSNRAASDPRLVQEMVRTAGIESMVLVPMMTGGSFLGLLGAANKPEGFNDADVQLLTIFAGPAGSFLRSRQIFETQKRHAARLERLTLLVGEMSATEGRGPLLDLASSRIRSDLGYDRVAFYQAAEGDLRLEVETRGSAGAVAVPANRELLNWALRGAKPLQAQDTSGVSELAVPVRAGGKVLGVLGIAKPGPGPFSEEEVNLLWTLAGQLAVALQKSEGIAETERLAAQMATLYDVGLETAALQDLRLLFVRATQEAGRLIKADHTSVLRYDEDEDRLRMFAAWARDPTAETYASPVFRLGEGVAGRVAQDRVPALINEPELSADFVTRGNPVSRLLCVPLTYYDRDRPDPVLFGILNATRAPGAPRFTPDDLEYLTRFANQLSIAVANSMAFAAERERSEQLALVNTLLREIAGNLSRERILETACRRIHEAFRYPLVTIEAPDGEGRSRRVVAAVGAESEPDTFKVQEIYAGIVGRAFRERQTVLVPDVAEDSDYIPAVAQTRSELAIPILAGGEVVAVLNVESDTHRGFDRAHVITLETLADGVGIILRNAELFEALETTNAKLVDLDRMKSELVNIVAHDFRAPLAGVLGHAELLEWRPEAPPEERVEQARAIINAATHMANLVDKTLKTTRLETGHFPFEFGLVDLASPIRKAMSRFPEDPAHPLLLDLPDDPMPCWADRDRLGEVVENLVTNAIKYAPDGGPVRITAQRQDETAIVTVADKGLGIATQDLGRLFRPFSRVRNKRTAGIEGSGLGLYICERIVRAHGGRLWVESTPDQGSAFSFSLPLYGMSAQTRAPLVLVAAGDERTRRAVRRVADEMGFTTHEVSDGVEAIEAAMRLVPAAVVLDKVLPKVAAGDVAARLRESVATEGVALIALAERGDLGVHASRFADFVPKPIDPLRLAAAFEGVARASKVS